MIELFLACSSPGTSSMLTQYRQQCIDNEETLHALAGIKGPLQLISNYMCVLISARLPTPPTTVSSPLGACGYELPTVA